MRYGSKMASPRIRSKRIAAISVSLQIGLARARSPSPPRRRPISPTTWLLAIDENSGPDNFLRYAFNISVDSPEWYTLERQFVEAHAKVETVSSDPRRTQDRSRETRVKSQEPEVEHLALDSQLLTLDSLRCFSSDDGESDIFSVFEAFVRNEPY